MNSNPSAQKNRSPTNQPTKPKKPFPLFQFGAWLGVMRSGFDVLTLGDEMLAKAGLSPHPYPYPGSHLMSARCWRLALAKHMPIFVAIPVRVEFATYLEW